MDDYPERFYTRFETLLCWFILVAAPIWATAAVSFNPGGWRAVSLFKLVGLLSALCVVSAAAVVTGFPVRLGASGIRSYDLWGRYSNISWEAVKGVELRNYLGFPFMRIESITGRVVYVTSWLRYRQAFLERVGELAGAENALTQALERTWGHV
jgi:hypothetical protein